MKYYAVIYTYGSDSELVDATRPAHREFISHQLSMGRILGSGPFVQGGQALIIVQLPPTSTVADAEAIMDEDPYALKNALAKREIAEWNPVANIFAHD